MLMPTLPAQQPLGCERCSTLHTATPHALRLYRRVFTSAWYALAPIQGIIHMPIKVHTGTMTGSVNSRETMPHSKPTMGKHPQQQLCAFNQDPRPSNKCVVSQFSSVSYTQPYCTQTHEHSTHHTHIGFSGCARVMVAACDKTLLRRRGSYVNNRAHYCILCSPSFVPQWSLSTCICLARLQTLRLAMASDPGPLAEPRCSPTDALIVVDVNTGARVQLAHRWQDARCVVVFLRHLGCALCANLADGLARVQPQLAAANVDLVAISLGSLEEGREWVRKRNWPGA